jgi:hypothetical protein
MLPDLNPIQWAVLAGAIALVIVPRLGVLKVPLGSLVGPLRRAPKAPDVHDKVYAYHTLATDLSADLAKQVWACIQSPTPTGGAGGAT